MFTDIRSSSYLSESIQLSEEQPHGNVKFSIKHNRFLILIDYQLLINKVSHNQVILTLCLGSHAHIKNLLILGQVIRLKNLLEPHDTAIERIRASLKNREK